MKSESGEATGAATILRRAMIIAASLLLVVTVIADALDVSNVGAKNWMLGAECALGVIVLILFVAWAKTAGAPTRFWVLVVSMLLWIAGVVLELLGLVAVSSVCYLAVLCLTIPAIVHDNRCAG